MPSHPKSVQFKRFKGINNMENPWVLPNDYLVTADNVNISNKGAVSKREGYTKIRDGSYISLWASENGLGCYAISNGDLVRIHDDLSEEVLYDGQLTAKASFVEIDDVIYVTSMEGNGRIIDGKFKEWGLPKQTSLPVITKGAGSLYEANYQVAISFVRSDGFESGIGRSQLVSVGNNSSISFTIPVTFSQDIVSARVYVSTPNGEELYYYGQGTPNTLFTISDIGSLTSIAKGFSFDKPPLGSIVRYYRGRIYIASGNILWYSEPFQYERFNLGYNYIQYESEILDVMPVDTGIWIGADKLYFLNGDEPAKFTQSLKEHLRVVKGTSTIVSSSYLHIDNTPTGYKWLVTTDLGVVALFNQGFFVNLTSPNVSLDNANEGTSVFLQDDGNNQYLVTLKKNEDPNNSVVGDIVESTIIRNGVTIT